MGRNKYIVTPPGQAHDVWLSKPDTKFMPQGQYRVTLRLRPAVARPLIKALLPLYEAVVAEAARTRSAVHAEPFYTRDDAWLRFRFKRFRGMAPDIFDRRRRPTTMLVTEGLIIRVSFEPVPYDTALATGLCLSLMAVQVMNVNETGTRFGF